LYINEAGYNSRIQFFHKKQRRNDINLDLYLA